MKTWKIKPSRIAAAAVLLVACVALVSWDFRQSPFYDQEEKGTDTIPAGKKRDTRVRSLDDAIEELESVELERDIEKALAEAGKALKEVDFSKIQAEIEKSIKEIDLEKLQLEAASNLAKV